MKKKTRRKYTDEFKDEAVNLVTDQGYKVTEAARNLGIHDGVLRRWIKESKPVRFFCPLASVTQVHCGTWQFCDILLNSSVLRQLRRCSAIGYRFALNTNCKSHLTRSG